VAEVCQEEIVGPQVEGDKHLNEDQVEEVPTCLYREHLQLE